MGIIRDAQNHFRWGAQVTSGLHGAEMAKPIVEFGYDARLRFTNPITRAGEMAQLSHLSVVLEDKATMEKGIANLVVRVNAGCLAPRLFVRLSGIVKREVLPQVTNGFFLRSLVQFPGLSQSDLHDVMDLPFSNLHVDPSPEIVSIAATARRKYLESFTNREKGIPALQNAVYASFKLLVAKKDKQEASLFMSRVVSLMEFDFLLEHLRFLETREFKGVLFCFSRPEQLLQAIVDPLIERLKKTKEVAVATFWTNSLFFWMSHGYQEGFKLAEGHARVMHTWENFGPMARVLDAVAVDQRAKSQMAQKALELLRPENTEARIVLDPSIWQDFAKAMRISV